ncbi:MAG: sugar phosphate isomerase/epimerase, partial [Chloroflexi bacterium]|nr:sugar phosphate isomerase/epimerase [Chloroflexota bacterium]
MKLGANSVLFGGHSLEIAFKYIALAGYDGIELSA